MKIYQLGLQKQLVVKATIQKFEYTEETLEFQN